VINDNIYIIFTYSVFAQLIQSYFMLGQLLKVNSYYACLEKYSHYNFSETHVFRLQRMS